MKHEQQSEEANQSKEARTANSSEVKKRKQQMNNKLTSQWEQQMNLTMRAANEPQSVPINLNSPPSQNDDPLYMNHPPKSVTSSPPFFHASLL